MRILRLPEVMRRTGLSAMTIWRKQRDGTFPRRVPLGKNSVGWIEDEIDEWIEARILARDNAPARNKAAAEDALVPEEEPAQ